MQTLGETREAVLDRDMDEVERLINKNKAWKQPFYIVIAYKQNFSIVGPGGEACVKRHVRAYPAPPADLMGTIVITYNPSSSSITDWKVNPHDVPIDYEALAPYIKGEGLRSVRSNVRASDYRYT